MSVLTVDGVTIGIVCYGTELTIVDYSRKDRDTYGNMTIIERGYSNVVSYVIEIEADMAYSVRDFLASIRAKKKQYVVAGVSGLSVEGYLNSFSIPIEACSVVTGSLEVESEVIDSGTYTVTFNLAGGTRTGGGSLVQSVPVGGTPIAPIFTPPSGLTFSSWSIPLDSVSSDTTITALYV